MNYKEYDEKPKKLSRTEVFSLGLKKEGKWLLLAGLLLALSLVPVITFRFLLILHEGEMGLAAENGTLSAEAAFNSVSSLRNMLYIASAVLVVPAAAVMGGIMKAAKLLSWRDKAPIKESFGEGMKENTAFNLFLFLLNLGFLWSVGFVSRANPESPFWSYLPGAVYALLVLPASMWALAASAVYKGSAALKLKNAFALTLKTYPMTLLTALFLLLPLFGLLIPWVYIQLILPLLYAAAVPYVWFAWVLFANRYFDEYVNVNLFPELYERGLN